MNTLLFDNSRPWFYGIGAEAGQSKEGPNELYGVGC
jgi:hypothetical protein